MLKSRTQHYTPRYRIDVTYLHQIADSDEWHIRFRGNDFQEAVADIKYCLGSWDKAACNGKGAWRVSLSWLASRQDCMGTQSGTVYSELCIVAFIWRVHLAERGQTYRPMPTMPLRVKQAFEKLGLPTTATEAELKLAYRKLARQHHPDAGGNHAEMVAINRAYEAVQDYIKRAA